MGRLDSYIIDLKNQKIESAHYEYDINDSFFESLETTEVQKGMLHAQVLAKKLTQEVFELHLEVTGNVIIPCDRCLDDMEQFISAKENLMVKFGSSYDDEQDGVIIIPEDEGVIDVSWHIYEMIALAIPIQHVHEEGMCNKEMAEKLKEHICYEADGSSNETENEIDPRWAELKKLYNNN